MEKEKEIKFPYLFYDVRKRNSLHLDNRFYMVQGSDKRFSYRKIAYTGIRNSFNNEFNRRNAVFTFRR